MGDLMFEEPILGRETGFEDPFFIKLHAKLQTMAHKSILKALEQIRIKPDRFGEIFATGQGTREELERIRRYSWR